MSWLGLEGTRWQWLFAVLIAGVVVTAFGVVVSSHYARVLFVELQTLESERDELNIEWGQLQIEQSTWATHGRIEAVAREKLGLVMPTVDQVRVLRAQHEGPEPAGER